MDKHKGGPMSTKTIIEEKVKVKVPKRYKVIMHNDDFTSMEFVVYVLVNIFKKENNEAVEIMLQVHKGGKAVVGVYSYDIAKTKVETTLALARKEGYPFKVELQEE